MSNKPRISVIIPAHCTDARHGTSRLRLTLLSLARQTLADSDYEIILVDNASVPALADQVAAWDLSKRVRVIRRESLGQGGGYNAALPLARAPLVMLGLDDELASPQLLAEHLRHQEDGRGGLVIGHCLTMIHTALFGDVSIGEPLQGALSRIAVQANTSWLPGAATAMGLVNKPVTEDDVTAHFDRVVAIAGFLPEFEDIEATVATGRCHSMPGGWLTVRMGNHSLPKAVIEEVGGLDEALDEFGSWYIDLELGIRLCEARTSFLYAEDAVSVNIDHPRRPGSLLGAIPAMAYLIKKHPRMDVALSPMYFHSGLHIREYARMLRNASRQWPTHWT